MDVSKINNISTNINVYIYACVCARAHNRLQYKKGTTHRSILVSDYTFCKSDFIEKALFSYNTTMREKIIFFSDNSNDEINNNVIITYSILCT